MATFDKVIYLANVMAISQLNGKVEEEEKGALEFVRQKIAADQHQFQEASLKAGKKGYIPVPVGRFSQQIENLEDMLLVSLIDGDLAQEEKKEMLAFAKKVKLSQDQINIILSETKQFIKVLHTKPECTACGTLLSPGTRFCIECGQKV
jgi:tellurite resistance protein